MEHARGKVERARFMLKLRFASESFELVDGQNEIKLKKLLENTRQFINEIVLLLVNE